MSKIHTRTGIVPVPTSQTGKAYDTWGFRQGTQESLGSLVGNNQPKGCSGSA